MNWVVNRIVDLCVVLTPTMVVVTVFMFQRFRDAQVKVSLYRRLAKKRLERITQLENKLRTQQAAYRALSVKFDRFVDESEAAETRLRHELVEARGSI